MCSVMLPLHGSSYWPRYCPWSCTIDKGGEGGWRTPGLAFLPPPRRFWGVPLLLLWTHTWKWTGTSKETRAIVRVQSEMVPPPVERLMLLIMGLRRMLPLWNLGWSINAWRRFWSTTKWQTPCKFTPGPVCVQHPPGHRPVQPKDKQTRSWCSPASWGETSQPLRRGANTSIHTRRTARSRTQRYRFGTEKTDGFDNLTHWWCKDQLIVFNCSLF